MNEEAQKKAKNLRAAQSVYELYEIYMLEQCPEVAHALRFQDTLPGKITRLAGSVFIDGEAALQGFLIRLQDEWAKCVGPSITCPVSFTPEDRTQQ